MSPLTYSNLKLAIAKIKKRPPRPPQKLMMILTLLYMKILMNYGLVLGGIINGLTNRYPIQEKQLTEKYVCGATKTEYFLK